MDTTNDLSEQIIELEQDNLVQTYKRPPFVLSRGEGVTVYDLDGKAYLDFVAGIAVNALGYGDPDVTAAIQQAATGLIHTSNLYYTAPQAELAAMLVEKSFADRVFFANSGAEANEGALKFARKLAYNRGFTDKTQVVCFSHAFHGRTLAAVSLTPKEKYQKPFKPLMPDVIVAEFNDVEGAKAVIGDRTVAVIVEPIQGEGGIYAVSPEFLKTLRTLCDEHQATLIFDEIQCGMGRSGKLWAYEESGVIPDIMTLAKPLAGGLPIGAILVKQSVADAMQPGDHGSTFAGGPLVTAVAKVVLEKVSQPEFLAHVSDVGDYLMERVSEINSPLIKEIRGRGLMVGVEFTVEVGPLVSKAYEQGLLLVNAGENVLRFVPPLILEKQHVDILIEKLTQMLGEIASE
ncbi:MAG: aspartate aminotransferase family protein [Anaerolineae bacterium]|nr:aspartate aminotransferase family protein [Anaerolineae bacterium]